LGKVTSLFEHANLKEDNVLFCGCGNHTFIVSETYGLVCTDCDHYMTDIEISFKEDDE